VGTETSGRFDRDTNYIRTRVTVDGRDGGPVVEAGRYRLIAA
jgi:glutathionyl-hydroquinone reductase